MKKQNKKLKAVFVCFIILFSAILFSSRVNAAFGDPIWEMSPGSINASSVSQYNSNYYVGGWGGSTLVSQIRMINSSGAVVWTKESPINLSGYTDNIVAHSSGLYITGRSTTSTSTTPATVLEKRSVADGSLLWSKILPLLTSAGGDLPHSIAVNSSGVYVAGVWNSGLPSGCTNCGYRIEKRSLVNGSVIWSLNAGQGGIVYDIKSDANYLYILRNKFVDGFGITYYEKRSASTGQLIWDKNIGDQLCTGLCTYRIALGSDGLYSIGNSVTGVGSAVWRVEKISLENGNLIWGKYETFPASMKPKSIDVDSSGLYVAGYENYKFSVLGFGMTSCLSGSVRLEKRDLSTGDVLFNKLYGNCILPDLLKVTSDGMFIKSPGKFEKREKTTVIPPPTVSISASPNPIQKGQTTTLSWTTTGASSCWASGGWTGWVSNTGGTSSQVPAANATYTVECWNSAGVTSTPRSVNVVVTYPSLAFSLSSNSINTGQSITLSWVTSESASCWGRSNVFSGDNDGGWNSGWKSNFSDSVLLTPALAPPYPRTITYYMQCWNAFGAPTLEQQVNLQIQCTPDWKEYSCEKTTPDACSPETCDQTQTGQALCYRRDANACNGSKVEKPTNECVSNGVSCTPDSVVCPQCIKTGNWKEVGL